MGMTRTRKVLAVLAWILAIIGGGWAMLFLMSCYMTTTGLIQTDEMIWALPLPIVAVALALGIQFWPRKLPCVRLWPWCLPVYLVAGGPLFFLVTTWLDQQFHK
jgi:chromate transport protein ChrA